MSPSTNSIGPHIKIIKSKGKTYYYYRMPDGRLESLGQDRKIASEAAVILTASLRSEGDIVEKILLRRSATEVAQNPPFARVIEEFIESSLNPDFKEGTLGQQTYDLKMMVAREYQSYLGDIPIADLTTYTLTTHLRERSGNTQVKHIALLNKIFKFAIGHCGYRETNPVSQMIPKKPAKRKRKRHTVEGIQKIKAASPPWLVRAIDIALFSLQRRGDLVNLHVEQHVNKAQKTIRVLQEKTRNYSSPVFIEICAEGELWRAIDESIRSDVLCPYLVHARPQRLVKSKKNPKPHPFYVLPDYLTKAFIKYRDLSGAYDHLPINERPAFHSIRALGIMLYFKAGYDIKYIMALAGHADEKTTQLYIDGHENKKAVKVAAGLDFNQINTLEIDWADTSIPFEIASLITDSEGADD